uniref:Uncharacterized protein n=1 Tax=Timema cristinae TaxID=61476 RepID=A0A7R9H419_TIMCR|nr:unnamed protein product [Timema cristinae]
MNRHPEVKREQEPPVELENHRCGRVVNTSCSHRYQTASMPLYRFTEQSNMALVYGKCVGIPEIVLLACYLLTTCEPANVLREILRTGGHLKDRLTIKLENDIRYGEVRVDHWIMHAKARQPLLGPRVFPRGLSEGVMVFISPGVNSSPPLWDWLNNGVYVMPLGTEQTQKVATLM